MVPGCTHALDMTLDDQTVNLNGATDVFVSINQNGTQLNFFGDRVSIADNGYQLTVYLTQDETLRFRHGTAVAQINWTATNLLGGVSRAATDPFVIEIGQQFMRQVL